MNRVNDRRLSYPSHEVHGITRMRQAQILFHRFFVQHNGLGCGELAINCHAPCQVFNRKELRSDG